jgi:hypothetical protein
MDVPHMQPYRVPCDVLLSCSIVQKCAHQYERMNRLSEETSRYNYKTARSAGRNTEVRPK